VQSLDFFPPLVDDPYLYGQIAAANSLSDVLAMGADPTTALNIVGFPDDRLDLSILSEILKGGAERIAAARAVLAGGHTVRDVEIKYGLSATGTVHPDRLITNRDARPGQVLILTKALGTGFVTTAFKNGRCPQDVLDAATASMIQLNTIGRDAARTAGARAATDITGFGLAGHAIEMALASNVTLEIDVTALPLLPGAAQLAEQGFQTRASQTNRAFADQHIEIAGSPDATRLEMIFDAQTSGGLLIAVQEDRADAAVQAARTAGAEATAIVGRVAEKGQHALIARG